ncbi:MAG: alpha-E domain-containing protein [Nitrospiraceae bacterium]
MLSRVASSIYWLYRYLERAESAKRSSPCTRSKGSWRRREPSDFLPRLERHGSKRGLSPQVTGMET